MQGALGAYQPSDCQRDDRNPPREDGRTSTSLDSSPDASLSSASPSSDSLLEASSGGVASTAWNKEGGSCRETGPEVLEGGSCRETGPEVLAGQFYYRITIE